MTNPRPISNPTVEFAVKRWRRVPMYLSRDDLDWLRSWLRAGVDSDPAQSRVLASVEDAIETAKSCRVFPPV